jgi:N-acetylglutamate synthase-like GNAT family acetyltransferase
MKMLEITRFGESDAGPAAVLIRRTLLEVNSRDYPADEIQRVIEVYSSEKIMALSQEMHLYVAVGDGQVVGCGAIGQLTDPRRDSIIRAVFVAPEQQGLGIGRKIMQALENDEYGKTAEKIILHASATARGFYMKLGYCDADNGPEVDKHGLYKMEKLIQV